MLEKRDNENERNKPTDGLGSIFDFSYATLCQNAVFRLSRAPHHLHHHNCNTPQMHFLYEASTTQQTMQSERTTIKPGAARAQLKNSAFWSLTLAAYSFPLTSPHITLSHPSPPAASAKCRWCFPHPEETNPGPPVR